MEHKVNKGADRGVEFSGLQAQYLYILAGGLLSVFLVFVILYMAGVNRWFCILSGQSRPRPWSSRSSAWAGSTVPTD